MQKNKYDKEYISNVNKASPSTPIIKNCIIAFLCGGALCAVSEIFFSYLMSIKNDEVFSRTVISITLIVITAVLTGIGVYDKAAAFAGAGLSVPISGFANSVCAPAIEFATEGHILGTAVKMFSIAGPVIVFGTFSAFIYGFIYWIASLL